jgi:hypothetical protein
MSKHMRRFYGFSVALLFGGMTALSFVAVPMLFAFLNNPALAGGLAAKYFALQHMFAVGLAVLVWLLLRKQLAKGVQRAWGGLALAAATSLWLVSPLIVSARATGGNLPLWHGIGSGLMLLQWGIATYLMWHLLGQVQASEASARH